MLRGDNMEYINQNAKGVRMSFLYLFPHSLSLSGMRTFFSYCNSFTVDATDMFDTAILKYNGNIMHLLGR